MEAKLIMDEYISMDRILDDPKKICRIAILYDNNMKTIDFVVNKQGFTETDTLLAGLSLLVGSVRESLKEKEQNSVENSKASVR